MMSVSSTFLLDQLGPKDIPDYIMNIFHNGVRNVAKITVQYSVRINDDNQSIYTLETIIELAYFLGTTNVVIRSHILPRKGGVLEEDDGSYNNHKKFYILNDEDDMKKLQHDIMYYYMESVRFLELLSSNPITVTITEYTIEDIMKEDSIQGGNENV